MSYLSREGSPISAKLWEQIDSTVVKAASNILTGRRFLHVFGPLGIGAESINIDDGDIMILHFLQKILKAVQNQGILLTYQR